MYQLELKESEKNTEKNRFIKALELNRKFTIDYRWCPRPYVIASDIKRQHLMSQYWTGA